jgi:phosphoglycerate dehydrogenase-like enzyme
MNKNNLLILAPHSNVYAELIHKLDLPAIEVYAYDTAEKAEGITGDCNIILGEPGVLVPILDIARRLQWIQSTFAGVEPLLRPGLRKDYILTGVKGIFGAPISDYLFAYILALERHLFQSYENQKIRNWQEIPSKSLRDRIMGICGLGSIGRHIAARAKHFDMKVWGFKRSSDSIPGVDRVFTATNFKAFLTGLDYLVIALPNTPETRHLIDRGAFLAMEKRPLLMNVGRGSIISEEALIWAVETGIIRGAVLDVFEEEPLPVDNPIWSLPNVFVTPHHAALSYPEDIVPIFAENYRLFREKRYLQHVIDFEKGY